MTEDTDRTITLDELRLRATRIADQAKADTREVVRRARNEELTRVIAVSAVVFAVAVSFAFYAGSRRCARSDIE